MLWIFVLTFMLPSGWIVSKSSNFLSPFIKFKYYFVKYLGYDQTYAKLMAFPSALAVTYI